MSVEDLDRHVTLTHGTEQRIAELVEQCCSQATELDVQRGLVAQHCLTLESIHDIHRAAIQRLKDEIHTIQWQADFQRRELERRCERLETEMTELRREPRTQVTHTTQIQNVQVNNFVGALNLDPTHMERVVDSTFNRDALVGGVDSLVQYAMTHLLTGDDGEVLYTASDVARHVFKYKDAATGEVMRDPKAAMLLRGLMPSVYRQVRALCPLGDMAWYDAEQIRDYNGLRVLEASYDQVMGVSPSNPNAFCKALVRRMTTQRMLPPVTEHTEDATE